MANSDVIEGPFDVFRDEKQGTDSVHLDWFGNDKGWSVAEGFRLAAIKVVMGAQSDNRHPDVYFWPVAFLQRHSIEIMLKEVIRLGADALELRFQQSEVYGHNLLTLWQRATSLIVQSWAKGDPAVLEVIERIIAEIHSIDPRGDAFRYRTAIDGQLHLQQLPRVFSLERMAMKFDEVFEFLDGVRMSLESQIDARHQMEQEY